MTQPSTPCVIVADGEYVAVYGLRGDRWTQFRAIKTKGKTQRQRYLESVAGTYGPRVKFKEGVDFRTDWKANDGWPDKINPDRLRTNTIIEDLVG